MSQLMMPNDANFSGFVHGGVLLSIADKVAYACASRHAETYCVTASVDAVAFRQPIHVGSLVIFDASVNWVGKTSMEVGMRVTAEDITQGSCTHALSCYFTMVAVSADGKPTKAPGLIPESDEERRRWNDAIERRKSRIGR